MHKFPASLAVLAMLVAAVQASDRTSLGFSDKTTIVGPGTDACASGVLIHNHDGSFENAYAWGYDDWAPPYFGAFAEGYDLGAGHISCGAYWLTTLPDFWWDPPADCYIWDGGVGSTPGAVLAYFSGVEFTGIPSWPTVRQYDVTIDVSVTGPFAIGIWPRWVGGFIDYFFAADEDGPSGHPWTCIAPGSGYPSGWQDPAVVWPNAKSMGCGVYFEQGTPVESETWGAVKAMYR